MSHELISAEAAIRASQPGSMIFSRVKFDLASDWQTALLIREEKKYVNRLGANPLVKMRGGLLEENNIGLVAVLLRIGPPGHAQLYESWFNYAAAADSFDDLATQERIAIVFFTPERGRAVHVRNGLPSLFIRARAELSQRPQWTMQAFDRARESLYARWPTPQALWHALAEGD